MKKYMVKKSTESTRSLLKKLEDQTKLNEELRREIAQCQKRFRNEVKKAKINHTQTQRYAYLIFKQHEEEKKNISRELHDEVAQLLTGISYDLSILSQETKTAQSKVHVKILRTQKLIEHSVEVVHRFARELRPIILDDLGLTNGLRSYVADFERHTKIKTILKINKKIIKIDDLQKMVLFRVVQEALSNVMKHSKATLVNITLNVLGDFAEIEIHDNGVSFNVDKISKEDGNDRLGLLGMKERVSIANGSLHISSSKANGTLIRAKIPLS